MCIQRIDENLAHAMEIVEALAEHEPELVEPVSAVLSIVLDVDDPAERAFRAWRMEPPMPGHADAPAFQIVIDTFETLKAEVARHIGCLAVSEYVLARQAGPRQEEAGFSWRKVRPGGIVFDDQLFLNAPVSDKIDTIAPVIVFGVPLSGGPPLPIVVDLAGGRHSLQDEMFWGQCGYQGLVGAPPTGLRLLTPQKNVLDVPFATVDWTDLDRVWLPPTLPEGARTAPPSLL